MKRLDWTLIRPARPGKKIGRVDELEARLAARVKEASRRVLTPAEVDKLVELEDRLEGLTIAACEAGHAPRVEDDPEWEHRIVDEFATSNTDYEREEYLDIRRREFDCDRCPHAALYSLYPQDPCEMSVGPLLDAIEEADVLTRLIEPMGPDDMREIADALSELREQRRFGTVPGLDSADLIDKAVAHLRFWGKLGFGIKPELIDDEDPIQTPEGPIGPPSSDSSSLLH